MNIEHVAAPLGEIHIPYNWTFANAAAREGAVIADAALIGRLARQLDDDSLWLLKSIAPNVWSKPNEVNVVVEDEGAQITASLRRLNFVGANVNAAESGGVVTVTVTPTDISGKQDHDADLDAIAALAPSNDDLLQRKEGAWVSRTPAQVKTDLALSKADVGLGSVNNTSDADKPVSTAQQAAIDGREPGITPGSVAQYWRGDKTWADFAVDVRDTLLVGLSTAANAVITASDTVLGALGKLQKQVSDNLTTLMGHAGNVSNPHGVTKAQVGLGNVDNTSDASKPVSTAQAAADATALNSAKAYADSLVTTLWDDRGNYDASGNTFPTSANNGSGAAGAVLKEDLWNITVAGVLGGVPVAVRQTVRALVDNPGQTASNWAIGLSNTDIEDTISSGVTGKAPSQNAVFDALALKLNSSANAVSATKLQTARNINGVAFDGTANITVADSTKLPLTGGTLTGDLTFSGASRRILGDFSNGAAASRTLFQTTTANSTTEVGAVPNGTSTIAQYSVYNAADPANSSSTRLQVSNVSSNVVADKYGTGSYLPLAFYTNGAEAMRIDTAGKVGIGATPSQKLHISGAGNTVLRVDSTDTQTASLHLISLGANYSWKLDADSSWRLSQDNTERFRIDTQGNLLVGVTSGSSHKIVKAVAEGSQILGIDNNTQVTANFFATGALGSSGAATAVVVGKNSSTSRSINAGGTINASGADYAEYMTKAEGCGVLTKGQIVGVDAQGKLTDKWGSAVSFLIKSTDPSYVGGDVWGSEEALGMQRPDEPQLILPEYVGISDPGAAPVAPEVPQEDAEEALQAYQEASEAYHQAMEQYIAMRATYLQERDQYTVAVQAAKQTFNEVTYPAYLQALSAFESALEAARQRVDRIAFCGQVPVNVIGASVGQYVVPVQLDDGIAGALVGSADMTLPQYLKAVGVVQNILPDGRANVRVKSA